ncbi:Molybdopterin synthase catalytic subunit 1 [Trichinella pseudospiralis]|uniref:Molybdopterin synthase catalytic subunit 1 n=1 Tax=Trichinella pseudospiralis TaxID=6337 RepID=A0A0V1FV43_TRIPS|nr:Molybdopterin synthase catalytic subunit 1 [Trichinella pseudospiralis]
MTIIGFGFLHPTEFEANITMTCDLFIPSISRCNSWCHCEMLEFDTGNWILLTEDVLNLESAVDFISHEENGAVSIFVGNHMLHVVQICMLEIFNFTGSVRKSSDQVDVAYLAYEAYDSMACKIFLNICSEIRKKWPTVHRICVHHRLGNVAVKEKSIIVAASAPHRAETLDAVKFAIDEIKKKVPIWKKEVYVDKTSKWKAN